MEDVTAGSGGTMKAMKELIWPQSPVNVQELKMSTSLFSAITVERPLYHETFRETFRLNSAKVYPGLNVMTC